MTTRYWPIAEVTAVHGLKGQLFIRVYSESLDNLKDRPTIRLGPSESQSDDYILEECRPFKKGALIRLKGVSRVEEAEAYVGSKVWLSDEEFREAGPDEVYLKDLIGAKLVDEEGTTCGEVLAAESLPAQTLLSIRVTVGGKARNLDIPFCTLYFGAWTKARGELVIRNLDAFIQGMDE